MMTMPASLANSVSTQMTSQINRLNALLIVASCMWCGACAFDGSNAFGGQTDASPSDARVDARITFDAAPDAEPLPALLSEGALVRYFLDEFPNERPGVLHDSIEPSFELGVSYDMEAGDSSVVNGSGNTGLRFASITEGVDKSKIQSFNEIGSTGKLSEIHNARKATLELVVTITGASTNGVICHIGKGVEAGEFSLLVNADGNLDFIVRNSRMALWWVSGSAPQRSVLHIVYDSTLAIGAERAKLYINGVLQANLAVGPSLDSQIQIGNDSSLFLGNRADGQRPTSGTFFYAAIYSKAFSAEDVSFNSNILQLDDDSRPGK